MLAPSLSTRDRIFMAKKKEVPYEERRDALLKKLGSKVCYGENINDSELGWISTGSLKLDWALTKPLVDGSVNEIYGAEQVGKTSLALEIAASAVAQGRPVFFFDLERKLRESSLNSVPGLSGENRTLFTRIRPDTGEESVDLVHDCIMEFPGCLIIYDSVSAMMPEVEGANSASQQTMGKVARLCWTMLRKNMGPAERNKCVLLFISHIAPKLNPYQTGDNKKGGNAISNLASQIIRLKRTKSDLFTDAGGTPIGHHIQCEIIKNNMGVPFRKVTVPLVWGRGIDKTLDLLQAASELCIIEKSGAWYYVPGKNEGDDNISIHGEKKLLSFIKENDWIRDKLSSMVTEILG